MKSRLESRPTFIYRLIDPRDGEVRYVGKTVNMKNRYYSHITIKKDRTRTKNINWIISLLDLGLTPIMELVEIVAATDDWEAAEIFWIEFYRQSGCNLTNILRGGGGSIGHATPDEVKERIRQGNKGKLRTQTTKDRMSATRKGVPKTEEEKLKNSESQKRRFSNPEARAKHKNAIKSQRIPVVAVSEDGVIMHRFDSVGEAMTVTGGKVSACLNNRAHTTCGFYWFRDMGKTDYKADVKKVKDAHGKNKGISQYTLDGILVKEYISGKVASQETGVAASSISLCVKGKMEKAGGFIWRYTN